MRLGLACLCALLAVGGCGPEASPAPAGQSGDEEAIRIASFDFAESELLAEIYALGLEDKGYGVERFTNLGPREIVQPALQQDRVDFVPEYLGAALNFVTLGKTGLTSNTARMHEALAGVLARAGIEVLDPSPAQDQNGIVVARRTATAHRLKTVSDLGGVDGDLVFGGPPECPSRPLCLPGLEETYGLAFGDFVTLDSGGPKTVAAIRGGEVDVALLFTTDPVLEDGDIVLLEDDRRLQPAENITPVLRSEVVDRFGKDLTDVVNQLSSKLTTAELRRLNRRVQVDGEDAAEVAREWLDRGV